MMEDERERMTRFACWILIGLLLGVFVAVTAYLLRERRLAGRDMPAYSVYSEASDGLGEAAQVLRRLGWTPVAVTRPIQDRQHRGLLILAEPPSGGLFGEEALSENDVRLLLRWVEQGNTLLLMSRANTALHEALHVVVNGGDKREEEAFAPVDLGAAGGYTEGIAHLSVGSRATLRAPGDALPLWWLGDQPGAVLLRRKKGRVLVVADARLLTREGLVRSDGKPRDDNVVFLANVTAMDARDGRVYFDEYHHGLRSGGGFWGYLEYHSERATPLLLLVVLLVAGWTWAVRLGPAVPAPKTASADAVDYASALARLYQKTGARRLLARTLVRSFLGALTRHLRLRRNTLPAEILAAWRLHDPGPSMTRLQTLLRGVGELRRGEVSDRQLLAWAQAFGRFTSEMQTTSASRKTK
jgi:cbb3-type cytochrome oxidase subunit 3